MSMLKSAFSRVSNKPTTMSCKNPLSLIALHNHLENSRELLGLISGVLPITVGALKLKFTLFQLLTTVPRVLVDDLPLDFNAYTAEGVPTRHSKRPSLVRVNRHADFAAKRLSHKGLELSLVVGIDARTASFTSSLLRRGGAVFLVRGFSTHKIHF